MAGRTYAWRPWGRIPTLSQLRRRTWDQTRPSFKTGAISQTLPSLQEIEIACRRDSVPLMGRCPSIYAFYPRLTPDQRPLCEVAPGGCPFHPDLTGSSLLQSRKLTPAQLSLAPSSCGVPTFLDTIKSCRGHPAISRCCGPGNHPGTRATDQTVHSLICAEGMGFEPMDPLARATSLAGTPDKPDSGTLPCSCYPCFRRFQSVLYLLSYDPTINRQVGFATP